MKNSRKKRGLGLFIVTTICVVATFSLRSRPATTSTAHATCQKLVVALRSGDMQQVQALTTAKGFTELQKAKGDTRFGSYAKVANRLEEEWVEDKTLEFLDSDRGFTRVWNEPSTWLRHAPTLLEFEGMSIGGDISKGIQFQRTPHGYKVDDYKPATEKTYQPYHHAMQIRHQSLVKLGLAKP